MDLLITADYVKSKGCPEPYLKRIANAGFSHVHWAYHYNTDFIYSIIAEEIGLIGALGVLALFVIFLIRGIAIAKFSGNRHTYLLVTGLTFLIVSQALINISVTIGIFPTKGMALPFISIGGSSLISTLMICGIIMNVSRHRKMVLLNE